jgi:hypothetical protein
LRPVERVIGVVTGLWDQHDVDISPTTVFETRYIDAAMFLGGIVHDRRPRNMFQLVIFKDA